MKQTLLKWFLVLSGLIQIGYWGISHIFFPQWYLRSVGLPELANNPGTAVVFLNEIGILTTGMGIATIMAAFNPIRYFGIIIVLCVVACGSIAISLYHITTGLMPPGEWVTIVILALQITVLMILFPWSRMHEQE